VTPYFALRHKGRRRRAVIRGGGAVLGGCLTCHRRRRVSPVGGSSTRFRRRRRRLSGFTIVLLAAVAFPRPCTRAPGWAASDRKWQRVALCAGPPRPFRSSPSAGCCCRSVADSRRGPAVARFESAARQSPFSHRARRSSRAWRAPRRSACVVLRARRTGRSDPLARPAAASAGHLLGADHTSGFIAGCPADGVRAPARYFMLVALFLSVLAGLYGGDPQPSPPAPGRRTTTPKTTDPPPEDRDPSYPAESWVAPMSTNVRPTPITTADATPSTWATMSPVYRAVRDMPARSC
jgi:hypothetical protein